MTWFLRNGKYAGAASALALAAASATIFFYAPVEATMGIVQKIFYFHVPAAMAAYLGFTITSVASFLYLLRPGRYWDMAAASGAEVGLLFCLYVLISGPIWAYKAWGQAWVWDPQLTATLVLFLLYGGYFLLRSLSDPNDQMRKAAAVLGVIAFIDIPLIHYAVQKWGGTHPVVEREGGGGLAAPIETTLSVSMVAFLLLFTYLFWLRFKVHHRQAEIDQLHLDIEDLKFLSKTNRGHPS